MIDGFEKERGRGLLRSRVNAESQFRVEYCIQRQHGHERNAGAPHTGKFHYGEIEYIRAMNGATIPRGKYDLEISADGATNVVGVYKQVDDWQFLPV